MLLDILVGDIGTLRVDALGIEISYHCEAMMFLDDLFVFGIALDYFDVCIFGCLAFQVVVFAGRIPYSIIFFR